MKQIFACLLLLGMIICAGSRCKKSGDNTQPVVPPPVTPPVTPPAATNDIDFWLTKSDKSVLLQKQTTVLSFGTTANNNISIEADTSIQYQTVDGFGYTLTGGSAQLINALSPADKTSLLQELFGSGPNAIGVSYLRISIGASDLNATLFTYDDMPAGQTDPTLANFSLAPDNETGTGLIPLLKQILAINPAIKIIATPWTAPLWMKSNGLSVGGHLLTAHYNAYAQYFVKYIQQMKAAGIVITAVTPQNEPLNPNNNPSLEMLADEQRDFIKNNLGPAFQAASINTKIIAYDHNCDRPDYPLAILNDAAARNFIDGSAFHLYAGDINVLSAVHDAYPSKNVYFTEQYTASTGDFGGDLKWHLKNVIIGSMRSWSRNALEWNLANDAAFGPYTPGGCTTCKGALTIGGGIIRNVAYYIIAHASKFVPAGSVRIATNIYSSLQNVAFKTPDGKKVLIVENDGSATAVFNIKFNNKWAVATLDAGAVATYIW
ncbi:MAG: glycoside hydrolase family 30 beta sandwich domain-containing protein [Chitinophagaceae bacterium]